MGATRRRIRKERNRRGSVYIGWMRRRWYYPRKTRLAWQKYERNVQKKIDAGLDLTVIPEGIYCYNSVCTCPYWSRNKDKDEQESGYCYLMEAGDWMPGVGLLWDQVKACGLKDDWKGDEEDDMRRLVSPHDMAELERVRREGFKEEYTYEFRVGGDMYRVQRPGWESDRFWSKEACEWFIEQLRTGGSAYTWEVYPEEKARAIWHEVRGIPDPGDDE